MVKWVLVGAGIFIVLAVIAGGVGLFLLTRQPPPLPTPTTAAPQPTPGPTTGQALPSLQEQLASVQQKIQETQKTGQRQEVKVTVTEAMANAELARALQSRQTGVPSVKDAKLYFREGYMEIVLTTEVAGFTLSPKVTATVTVVAGKPQVNVQSIDLGSLPLPGTLKDQASQMVADQLSKIQLIDAPVEVTAVKISNQYMEITGLTRVQ